MYRLKMSLPKGYYVIVHCVLTVCCNLNTSSYVVDKVSKRLCKRVVRVKGVAVFLEREEENNYSGFACIHPNIIYTFLMDCKEIDMEWETGKGIGQERMCKPEGEGWGTIVSVCSRAQPEVSY
ncbi:hypothetical protein LOAG_11952 [Loa loa]|uniref:Uncharacterized protein n=1 Tax=Loa loa TaxID=7209 RepID=A0A1S0TM41_LOALO|nr:hypothetical protein LOAG_11952 [Loa loa]EFO16553.1 hypothetical protein LOAG_11952 [Loa loa]